MTDKYLSSSLLLSGSLSDGIFSLFLSQGWLFAHFLVLK